MTSEDKFGDELKNIKINLRQPEFEFFTDEKCLECDFYKDKSCDVKNEFINGKLGNKVIGLPTFKVHHLERRMRSAIFDTGSPPFGYWLDYADACKDCKNKELLHKKKEDDHTK